MKRLAPFVALVALVACTPEVEPPHLLWSADPLSLDNPLPDARQLVDGAWQLPPKWYTPYVPKSGLTAKGATYFNSVGAAAAREVRALGNLGPTLLRPSEPLDPDSVPGTVARLVRDGDGWRVLEREVLVQHTRDVLAARGLDVPEGFPEYLFVRPSVPLPEGQEGLLVVLAGLRTRAGAPLGRGFAWRAAAPPLGPVASALGVKASEVLLALPQRAGDVTGPLRQLAAWAEANPAPVTIPPHGVVPDENNGSRPEGLWRSTDADWGVLSDWLEKQYFGRPASDVGTVVIGTLGARDVRENGVFRADWVANPSLAPVVPLRFVLTVPKGPKPAGGWPVVMGQHGVAGRNTPRVNNPESYCLEWAQALAARGLGCIGIDAPNHGSRGTFTQFFALEDLPALRDRFREMTFDLLQVERAVATIDVDGDGAPDLAPTVRYFGNSMGAIMGSGFVPVANRVSSAVLNVPGAGLSNLVMSVNLRDLIGLLLVAKTDLVFDSPEYVASFPLFRAASQPFFDPGDPLHVAQVAKAEQAVLLQAGLNDQIVPNDTSDDLARALALSPAAAADGTAPVRAYMKVDAHDFLPKAEADAYNGHNVMWNFVPIREQVLNFLASDGRRLTMP